jgi:hypothetical protein
MSPTIWTLRSFGCAHCTVRNCVFQACASHWIFSRQWKVCGYVGLSSRYNRAIRNLNVGGKHVGRRPLGRPWKRLRNNENKYWKIGTNLKFCLLTALRWFLARLKTEATCYTETSVDSERTMERYIVEDRTLYNHRRENPNSCLENCVVGMPDRGNSSTLCLVPGLDTRGAERSLRAGLDTRGAERSGRAGLDTRGTERSGRAGLDTRGAERSVRAGLDTRGAERSGRAGLDTRGT